MFCLYCCEVAAVCVWVNYNWETHTWNYSFFWGSCFTMSHLPIHSSILIVNLTKFRIMEQTPGCTECVSREVWLKREQDPECDMGATMLCARALDWIRKDHHCVLSAPLSGQMHARPKCRSFPPWGCILKIGARIHYFLIFLALSSYPLLLSLSPSFWHLTQDGVELLIPLYILSHQAQPFYYFYLILALCFEIGPYIAQAGLRLTV